MRKAAARLHTGAMNLERLCGGGRTPLLERPQTAVAQRPAPQPRYLLCPAGSQARVPAMAAAAEAGGGAGGGTPDRHPQPAGGRQQQRAGVQQQPQQPAGGQQHAAHQASFESMKKGWNVKRTELQNFPEATQQHIRSSSGSSSSIAGSAAAGSGGGGGQARTLASLVGGSRAAEPAAAAAAGAGGGADTAAAASAAGGRGQQAALSADLQKLAAALEYERQKGYINVVGSIERVPLSVWAGRRLLDASSQLPEEVEASHGCFLAAQRMRRYDSAGLEERMGAVAAAEAAAQAALRAVQVGGRTLAGRQGRHAAAPAAAAAAVPAEEEAQPAAAAAAVPAAAAAVPAAAAAVPAAAASVPAAAVPAAAAAEEAAALAAAVGPAEGTIAAPLGQQPEAPSEQAAQGQEGQQAEAFPQFIQQTTAPAGGQAVLPELDAAAEEAHEEESGQQRHTPEGEAYVMSGGRRIKASTAAFRRSFAEAAAALGRQAAETAARGGQAPLAAALAGGGEQRTEAWLRLRERRLTASAFSKAIGLFDGDRQQLWGEKVGMVEPFQGNAATAWGTSAEPRALEAYQAATGQRITSCMFQVRHDDPVHGWLGASPDGLIESLSLHPSSSSAGDAAGAAGTAAAAAAAAAAWPGGLPSGVVRGAGPLAGRGRGILEIKCPHNRGQPELAVPPQHATWYYMPQVQGLMYIFDCEWCNLYIWTPQRGSAVYHVVRDRKYWGCLWEVLADFWWNHVVPARQEFQAGRWEEVEQYRPTSKIDATEELRAWSKRMALAAPVTVFAPQQQQQQHDH